MDGSLNGETWRFIVRNIRIGVVEDDPASCQLVLDYLNRYQSETGEQFTVSVFDDGARIVEKYSPVYDILLLDIEMKEMDGMEAARRIRERDDKVVIIFITAAPQYAISGYEVRALSYLLKPLPWFAFSQELKKSIDMVRRNDDDSMLIDTGKGQMRLNLAIFCIWSRFGTPSSSIRLTASCPSTARSRIWKLSLPTTISSARTPVIWSISSM